VLDRLLITLVAVSIALSLVAATGIASLGDFDTRVINLLLLLFSPVAISLGMVADMRTRRRVTVRTILGVLSIYLLIGLIFTFIFGIVASERMRKVRVLHTLAASDVRCRAHCVLRRPPRTGRHPAFSGKRAAGTSSQP